MKISCIIPVRDTASFLDECLTSVLAQTHSNLEVLAVDDGSMDGSRSILDHYSRKDRRVRVFETPRLGAATARNLALREATGDWFAFLDSDDKLPIHAYAKLAVHAKEQTDVVTGIAESFSESRRWINEQMQELSFNIGPPRPLARIPALGRDASPCNKLFRATEFADLRFPEGIDVREDLHFVLRAYARARRIHVVPDIVYYYRLRAGGNPSVTQQKSEKSIRDLIWVARDLEASLGEELPTHVRRVLQRGLLGNVLYRLREAVAHSPAGPAALLDEVSAFVRTLDPEVFDAIPNAKDALVVELLHRRESDLAFEILTSDGLGAQTADRMGVLGVLDARVARLMIHAQEDRVVDAQRELARAERAQLSLHATEARARRRIRALVLPHAREVKLAAARRLRSVEPHQSRPLWVVGERRGLSTDDTGFRFFRHLRDQRPDIEAIFVTSPQSARKLDDQEGILRHGDLSVVRALLRADAVIYSDSCRDLYRHWTRLESNLRSDTVCCFLQHGIIALHGMRGYYHRERMASRGERADVFVVSSERERALVIDDLGHHPDDVVVTGLSRFDDLEVGGETSPMVLVAPTWRSWLRHGASSYARASFLEPWLRLLLSHEVKDAAERTGCTFVLAPHFSVRGEFEDAIGRGRSYLRVMGAGESMTALVRTARAVITDYSSVAFDFAYSNRASMFFRFDETQFLTANGTLGLATNTLPGPVASTARDATEALTSLARRNWIPSPDEVAASEAFFAHRDKNNCARIAAAIDAAQRRRVRRSS